MFYIICHVFKWPKAVKETKPIPSYEFHVIAHNMEVKIKMDAREGDSSQSSPKEADRPRSYSSDFENEKLALFNI